MDLWIAHLFMEKKPCTYNPTGWGSEPMLRRDIQIGTQHGLLKEAAEGHQLFLSGFAAFASLEAHIAKLGFGAHQMFQARQEAFLKTIFHGMPRLGSGSSLAVLETNRRSGNREHRHLPIVDPL